MLRARASVSLSLTALFALASLVGCGGDDAPADASGDGGPSGEEHGGVVSLTQTLQSGAQVRILAGYFTDATGLDLRRGRRADCVESMRVGSCVAYSCDGSARTLLNGGLVAEVDGTEVMRAMTPVFGAYFASGNGRAFVERQMVRIAGTGSDVVGAFEGTLAAPGPLASIDVPSSVASGGDLGVSWDPTVAAEDIHVEIAASGDRVVCVTPTTDGALGIAGSLTGTIPPGSYQITITAQNTLEAMAGTRRVLLVAGDGESIPLTLE